MEPKALHFPRGTLGQNHAAPASRSLPEHPGDDRRALEAEAPGFWTVF